LARRRLKVTRKKWKTEYGMHTAILQYCRMMGFIPLREAVIEKGKGIYRKIDVVAIKPSRNILRSRKKDSSPWLSKWIYVCLLFVLPTAPKYLTTKKVSEKLYNEIKTEVKIKTAGRNLKRLEEWKYVRSKSFRGKKVWWRLRGVTKPVASQIIAFEAKKGKISSRIQHVIQQAESILKCANKVYIMVPPSRNLNKHIDICKEKGIGVFLFEDKTQGLEELLPAKIHKHVDKKSFFGIGEQVMFQNERVRKKVCGLIGAHQGEKLEMK